MSSVVYTQGGDDGPAFKLSIIDLIVPVTATISRIFADIALGVDMIDDALRAHGNWKRTQDAWHQNFLSDIEKL